MRADKSKLPTWPRFRVRHAGRERSAFEQLCKEVFARELGISPGDLVCYENQTGIECEPYQQGDRHLSFQAKFKADGSVDFPAFHNSLKKAFRRKAEGRYKELTKVVCFSNKGAGEDNKKRDAIESDAAAAGVEIEWRYGGAILERLQEDRFADIRKRYFGAGRDLPVSMPTTTPSTPTRSLSALKYTSRVTEFVGRDAEVADLRAFVDADADLAWWVIGGKGATGKSRLALEICEEYAEKGWHCGFYDHSVCGSQLPDWDPERPHLIIVDYSSWDPNVPATLLKHAKRLADSGDLSFRIRILLIDRDAAATIQGIRSTRTFGEALVAHLQNDSPLTLEAVPTEALSSIVSDLARFFGLSESAAERVLAYSQVVQPERRVLVAGLCALRLHMDESDAPEREHALLIRGLIDRERQQFWAPSGVGEDREPYLLLATMADGIELDSENLGPAARQFLDAFDFPEEYATVVGEEFVHRLAPLSHDLVNELFVLDSFDTRLPRDQKDFAATVRVCLEIEAGRGLVNFFTRAANDWPKHPTLSLLIPRFGQTPSTFTPWLVLISNVIDRIDTPTGEKASLFNHVAFGLQRDDEALFRKLVRVLEGFFLRVLREAAKTDALDRWVHDYSVEPAARVPTPESDSESIPGMRVQVAGLTLRSRDYCEATVSSIASLPLELRQSLTWPGLLEIYHHAAIHRLADRATRLQKVVELVDHVVSVDQRWNISPILRDIVVALVQFGRLKREPEDSQRIIEIVLEHAPRVGAANGLDALLSAVSAAYGHGGVPYERKKKLLDLWDSQLQEATSTTERTAEHFVAFCVALMHGFSGNRDNLDTALSLCDRTAKLTKQFPTPRSIEHLSMVYEQLSRRERNLLSEDEANEMLDKAIELARRFGAEQPELVSRALRALSTRFTIAARNAPDTAKSYFDTAIQVCTDYSPRKPAKEPVYVGDLLATELKRALKESDFDSARALCVSVNRLQENASIDISHFWPATTGLFSAYQSAVNRGDPTLATSIADVVRYWLENLVDPSHVQDLFSSIMTEHQRRNPAE